MTQYGYSVTNMVVQETIDSQFVMISTIWAGRKENTVLEKFILKKANPKEV